jgi:hypothetical protein
MIVSVKVLPRSEFLIVHDGDQPVAALPDDHPAEEAPAKGNPRANYFERAGHEQQHPSR